MLTAEDLVDFPLKMAVRGYSVAQVDDLLDRAADSLDRLHARVADLEEQLAECQAQLSSTAETEGTLKRTLITAQRAAEQSLDEARARAASIVEDAERQAREQAEDAERQARERSMDAERRRRVLEDRVAELREFEQSYRAELRALLEQRLEALEGIGDTVAPVGGPQEVPGDVADLVDLPGDADDRPPLTVRVHDEDDGGSGDGGDSDDGPLAWRPPEEPRPTDRSDSDAETTGD